MLFAVGEYFLSRFPVLRTTEIPFSVLPLLSHSGCTAKYPHRPGLIEINIHLVCLKTLFSAFCSAMLVAPSLFACSYVCLFIGGGGEKIFNLLLLSS